MPWPSTATIPRLLLPVERVLPEVVVGAEDAAESAAPGVGELLEQPASATIDSAVAAKIRDSLFFMVWPRSDSDISANGAAPTEVVLRNTKRRPYGFTPARFTTAQFIAARPRQYSHSMDFTTVPTLTGTLVTLEPLTRDHASDLASAVGELWRTWYTHVPAPDEMPAEIERRLALREAGSMLPFAAMRNDTCAAVGMTTFMNLDPANRRLEIGSTWLAKSAQRTGINVEAKLLMLGYAFDQ